MNPRQEEILKIIIEEYTASAEPVGSGFLVEKYDLGVSPATVRNDMVVLESDGFLRQPHTSAGRVPTEKGYQYYLANYVKPDTKSAPEDKMKQVLSESDSRETGLRNMAKLIAEISGETAIVCFGSQPSYFTGLANLFAKPDFQDLELMQHMSEMVDSFDEVMNEMLGMIEAKPQVLIGSQSPFGSDVSTVVVRLFGDDAGLLGLMGPMRMDYGRNLQLVQLANELLEEFYE